jgi:hemoglobin
MSLDAAPPATRRRTLELLASCRDGCTEAHHRVSAAAFKYYVTEMVCWATGGPQNYTGRSMSESHKHLKITESEWAAFCKDFDDTMAKFDVPEAEHKELFAIVESTKDDIVSAPSSL